MFPRTIPLRLKLMVASVLCAAACVAPVSANAQSPAPAETATASANDPHSIAARRAAVARADEATQSYMEETSAPETDLATLASEDKAQPNAAKPSNAQLPPVQAKAQCIAGCN